MKCFRNQILLVSLVVCLLASRSTAIESPRRTLQPTQTTHRILELRGGDLGPVNGKSLAVTFSGLAAVDAVFGSLSVTSMRWFGIYLPKGSLSDKYLHGIGASAASIAVSTYLAVTGTAVEKAIAYGLLTRMAYMALMILTDEEKKVGMRVSMFATMWLCLGATVYSLLQGMKDSLALAKVISLVLGVHGLFLHTYPGVVLRKTCISVGPDPLEKDILSIDGGYMLASAVTTFLLAQRIDPVKVAGFSAIAFLPVMIKIFGVVEAENLWDFGIGHCAMAATFLVACIIVGTLH